MSSFLLGFLVGYGVSTVLDIIIEIICIKLKRSQIDKWMEVDDESN